MQEIVDGVYGRLLKTKQLSAFTEKERSLLYTYLQLSSELGRRFDTTLKEDETTKKEARKLTPAEIGAILQDE